MELMTEEIEAAIEKRGYIPKMDDLMDAVVLVKYFEVSSNCTWLIIGGERYADDWELYGYVDIGYGWDWGPVYLSELENFRGRLGLGVERDLDCSGKTVRQLAG